MHQELFQKLANEMADLTPHISSQQVREDWLKEAMNVAMEDVENLEPDATGQERLDSIEKRTMKHIQRLTSFGGTDIGILYMKARGEYYPYTDEDGRPKDEASVVKSKLGILAPTPTNGDMRRGIVLEPTAKTVFEKNMADKGFKARPDLFDIFTTLYTERHPDHPWLCGMPDGIYEDSEKKIHLVDYKVPANPDNIEHMKYNPPTMYVGQLATYKAILELHGIPVEQCWLAPLSVKDMNTTEIQIDMPENIAQEILALGDKYWKHVLDNDVPFVEFSKSEDFEKIDNVPSRLSNLMDNLVYWNKAKNIATKKEKDIRNLLETEMRVLGYVGQGNEKKTQAGPMTVNEKESTSLVTNRLKEKFVELGGDLSDPALYETNLTTRLSITRSKSSPYYQDVARINNLAEEILQDGILEIVDSQESNESDEAVKSDDNIEETAAVQSVSYEEPYPDMAKQG